MQQVNIIETVDVQGMIDNALGPWVQWSEQVTNQINEISSHIADILAINLKQTRRINSLAARIQALEDQLASTYVDPGEYSDTY